ncbi:MAG: hypothetical protein GWN09_02255 [Gammaproteobacteria bacterium]|nr:PilZ domain-containing protein [Gammaproteobacteria bacterium]NIW85421.1 hypothetical protein [Gammaproteobacteria bacterium]
MAVELWRDDNLLGHFETRDIAPEGAFVETGPTEVEPYELLTLVLRNRKGQRVQQLRAMVVHRSEEGAGLLYEAEAPALYRRLTREVEAA